MAAEFQIDNLTCIAALNAIVDLLDDGTIPVVRLLSGTKPAQLTTADDGDVLAIIPLDTTNAFGAATDDDPGAVAAVTGTPTANGEAAASTGTPATYWRAYSDTGGTPVCRMQGTCGTTSADFILSPGVTIVEGEPVTILTWNVRLGEGG